jgi:hypothetical protein
VTRQSPEPRQPALRTRKTQSARHNRQQECSLPYGRQREPSVIRRSTGVRRAHGPRDDSRPGRRGRPALAAAASIASTSERPRSPVPQASSASQVTAAPASHCNSQGTQVPDIPVGNASRLSCATLPGEPESESVLMLDLNACPRMRIDNGPRFPDRGADDAAPENISDHVPLHDTNGICCIVK